MAAPGYWQKRNARAKALGYRNYYDYRAHDNGRIPPERPALKGPELARARGHASAADLSTLLRRKRVEMLSVVATIDNRERLRVDALATLDNGQTMEFQLRERELARVRSVIDETDPEAVLLIGSPRVVQYFVGQKARDWTYTTRPAAR